MAELPFQQPQTLNERQNRALALAAVFQSAQLTHMTALSGQQSIGESGNFYLEQLIKASFKYPTKGQPKRANFRLLSSAGGHLLRTENLRK